MTINLRRTANAVPLFLFLSLLLFSQAFSGRAPLFDLLGQFPRHAVPDTILISKPDEMPCIASTDPRLRYIARYKELAVSEMKRSGVPASILIGQGIVETNGGQSEIARVSNNQFCVRCPGKHCKPGCHVLRRDAGKLAQFKAYLDDRQAWAAHTDLLMKRRYQPCHCQDFEGWAKCLQQQKYATAENYARVLTSIINQYQLQSLDNGSIR